MSLENYTGNISDLVATNPTGTDPRSQGDDHLRGIKYTLKQSFPLATGPVRVSGDKLFAGDSADNTKNFVIDASADNGTMKLARESGQDIMTVDAAGKVAFPQLPNDLSPNGSATLPNGLIIKWGLYAGGGDATIAFPVQFPSACVSVSAIPFSETVSTDQVITAYVSAVAPTGFTVRPRYALMSGGGGIATQPVYWIAIGY
jgi:hypothetical protein